MLKAIMKHLKPAAADQPKKVEEMTDNEQPKLVTHTYEAPADAASYHAVVTELADQGAQLATATEALASMQEQMAQLTANFEAVQAALNASEEAKKEFAAQAATKRLEARTAALSAAIGKDNKNLATMLAATDALDDKQFNDVAKAMSTNFETEAKSTMFQETGVAASVDASTVQEESKEMKILKAQYQKSK